MLKFDGQAPVLRVNKAWFEAAVPIGFALVIFRSLQGMWRDIGDLRAGREPFAGKAMFEEMNPIVWSVVGLMSRCC